MKPLKGVSLGICLVMGILLMPGCATKKRFEVTDADLAEGPDAYVDFEFKEFALGIGKAKGEGTLYYQDQEYPFTLSGIDYGSISKIHIIASGAVYHLESLDEFEGLFFQARAALSVGSAGKTGIFLMNKHGVTIHASSDEESGFDMALGRGGVKIAFEE